MLISLGKINALKADTVPEFAAELIARIGAGESERSACRAIGVDRNRVYKSIAANPEFRDRMAAAKLRGRETRKKNPRSSASVHFNKFVELVAAGGTYDQICRDNPEFPDASVFQWLASKDPDRRARLDAALDARMAGPWVNAKPTQLYTEADYDRALAAFSQRTRWRRWRDGGLGSDLPAIGTLRDRARREPAFRQRLTEAVALRPQHVRIASPKIVRREGEHGRRLSDCDLYAAASRLVPRSFIERDDLISQIVLGVLEGDISRHELTSFKTVTKRLRVARNAMLSVFSLDTLVPTAGGGQNSETFIDQITADEWVAA